jgi:DNA polymerase III subunit delta
VPGSLTPQSCEEQIGAGRLQPIYLLTGPDDEQKARLVTLLIETVEADLRPFNVDKFFPADVRDDARKQFWTVLQLARTLPMMAPRRIVVMAQADRLMPIFKQADDEAPEPGPGAPGAKTRRPASKAAGEAELEALDAYLSNPSPECVLVFVAGEKLNRNLKPVKLLEKWAAVVECDPLAGGADAIAWVKEEAAGEGVRIEPSAARLLAGLAGGDIARLRTEFERVLLFASGDGIITEAAVREIAAAPTATDPWAITNAISRGDAGQALRQLAMKLDAGEIPVMILGQLAWYVRAKMASSRVASGIDAVFRTDLALKTSGGDPAVLLERLVIELCG